MSLLSRARGGSSPAPKGAKDPQEPVLSRCLATKVHRWRGKYGRIFELTGKTMRNLDPDTWKVTNEWPWRENFGGVVADPADETAMTLTITSGTSKEDMKFTTNARAFLIGEILRISAAAVGAEPRSFNAKRICPDGEHVACELKVHPHAATMADVDGMTSKTFDYVRIAEIGKVADDPQGFFLRYEGVLYLVTSGQRDALLKAVHKAIADLGIPSESVEPDGPAKMAMVQEEVTAAQTDPELSHFDVRAVIDGHAPTRRTLSLTATNLVIRDVRSYGIISITSLGRIAGIVRHVSESQRITIEFADGAYASYLCTERDTLLATLLDAARSASVASVQPKADEPGKFKREDQYRYVAVTTEPSPPAFVIGPGAGQTNADVYEAVLKRVVTHGKDAAEVEMRPHSAVFADDASYICANLESDAFPVDPLEEPAKRTVILTSVITPLITQLSMMAKKAKKGQKATPTGKRITLLLAIDRLLRSPHVHSTALDVPGALVALEKMLISDDDLVAFTATTVIATLCAPCGGKQGQKAAKAAAASPRRRAASKAAGDEGKPPEGVNKGKILAHKPMIKALFEILDRGDSASGQGAMLVMAVAGLLESILCGFAESTPKKYKGALLKALGRRTDRVLALFRSRCLAVNESAAMLVREMLYRCADDTKTLIKSSALTRGVFLHHFHQSMFSADYSQRHIARYMCGLWLSHNRPALALIRRMLPPGITHYLSYPAYTASERRKLEMKEETRGQTLARERVLVSILKVKGLEGDGDANIFVRVTPVDMSDNDILRDVQETKVASQSDGAASWDTDIYVGDRCNLKKVEELRIEVVQGNPGETGVIVGSVTVQMSRVKTSSKAKKHSLEPEGSLRLVVQRLEQGADESDTSTRDRCSRLKGAVKKAKEKPPPENVLALFFNALDDHSRAELLWHRDSRAELRAAIDAELRDLTQEGGAAGAGGEDFAWNHQEFRVAYPSLEAELTIGHYFLRLLLEESEKSGHVTLTDPKPFFDALYLRALREPKVDLRAMCFEAMALLYKDYKDVIGIFPDTAYIMELLDTAKERVIRDRLLVLIDALIQAPENAEALLQNTNVELLVDIVALGHTAQSVTPLSILQQHLTAGNAPLMISGGTGGSSSDGAFDPTRSSSSGASDAGSSASGHSLEHIKEWRYRDPNPPGGEVGPISVKELGRLLEEEKIGVDTLCWADGMDDWSPIGRVRQLRWRLLTSGDSLLSAGAAAGLSLKILRRLLTLHAAVTADGKLVRPIPRAKRFLSSRRCLPHIVQSILSGHPEVIESATLLLLDLVDNNSMLTSKLYSSGFFYFALSYTGSNYLQLSKMLERTHLDQHHRGAEHLNETEPLAQRSILGTMIPESMLKILENYGPKRFAEAFLGNFDTPEVIWKYSMRKHLVMMITQHLNEFALRLADNVSAVYTYDPFPGIAYPELEHELWCHNYYLQNLCDPKFSDWPVKEPVALLSAVLMEWRTKIANSDASAAISDALALLELPDDDKVSSKKVRSQYRKLAKKYHPDKNPGGAEHFRKIHAAYEVLAARRGKAGQGEDTSHIELILRTQCALFNRYVDDLEPYKYAGYPFLLGTLTVSNSQSISPARFRLLVAGTELVYLTCLCSPMNAEELIAETEGIAEGGGTGVLTRLMARCKSITNPTSETDEASLVTISNILHTLAGLSALPSGRDMMASVPALTESLAGDMVQCLTLRQSPRIMQYNLETISRAAENADIQSALLRTGALWLLLPLMFCYDATLDETDVDASIDTNEQLAANMSAQKATTALAKLGGYLGDTPVNEMLRGALCALITPNVADLLEENPPLELLRVLNGRKNTPSILWGPPLREELLNYVENRIVEARQDDDWSATPGLSFRFDGIKTELMVGHVWIRVYNEVAEKATAPVDDPRKFARDLLSFVEAAVKALAKKQDGEKWWSYADDALTAAAETETALTCESGPGQGSVQQVHMCLVALKHVFESNPGTEDEAASRHLPLLFKLLKAKVLRNAALNTITALARDATCAAAVAEERLIAPLLKLLWKEAAMRRQVLRIFVSLCESRPVCAEMGRVWAMLSLLRLLVSEEDAVIQASSGSGDKSYQELEKERGMAALVLSKIVREPVLGPKQFLLLQRFLPLSLARMLREEPAAAVKKIDRSSESPELIWNRSARDDLRAALAATAKEANAASSGPSSVWEPSADFRVRYSLFDGELCVGGVYLRLYMKEPTFALHDAKQFLESLVPEICTQVGLYLRYTCCCAPHTHKFAFSYLSFLFLALALSSQVGHVVNDTNGGATGKRAAAIATLTSGIVSLLKVRGSLADRVAGLGHVSTIFDLLKRSRDHDPRGLGVAKMSCVRVIHQIAESSACSEEISSVREIIIVFRFPPDMF